MTDPLLSVQDLSVTFKIPGGSVQAVRGLTYDIMPGEIVGIVGESGSGKSQSTMAMLGLLAKNGNTDGSAVFKGQELLGLKTSALNKIRGADMAMVFQDPMTGLNPYLRIQTQLIEAIRVHQRMSKKQAYDLALEMMRKVAIPEPEVRMAQYPHEFSGGMRQRIMIAMALLNNPSLVIADEPTTALDVTIQAQILELLKSLQSDLETAVLFITHDLGVVAELCDRVLVMYAGKIVESATVEELFANPQHPYTRGLIAATPRTGSDGQQALEPIPGNPPNLENPPQGCAFADRCFCMKDRCKAMMPELELVGPGHHKACFAEAFDAAA